MRYLAISTLLLVFVPVVAAQNSDPWGRNELDQQQRQQQSYEQERQRSYQQERQQQEQRYEQEKRQSAEDAVRRERAIQSERRGEPAPGRSIYQFGK